VPRAHAFPSGIQTLSTFLESGGSSELEWAYYIRQIQKVEKGATISTMDS